MNKRILAMAMAVAMLVTCVPQTAYATNGDTSQTADASVSDANNSQGTDDDTTTSDPTANDGLENNGNTENVTTSTEGTDDVTNSSETDATTDIIESETEVVSATGNGNENAVGVILTLSGGTTLDEISYSSFEAAVEDLPNQKNKYSTPITQVTVNVYNNCQLTKDITIDDSTVCIYGAYTETVLDLNGHTINFSGVNWMNLKVKSSSTTAGRIVAPMSLNMSYSVADWTETDQVIIDNVDIEAPHVMLEGNFTNFDEYMPNYTLRVNGNIKAYDRSSAWSTGIVSIGGLNQKVIFGASSIVEADQISVNGDVQFQNVSGSIGTQCKSGVESFTTGEMIWAKAPKITIAGKANFKNIWQEYNSKEIVPERGGYLTFNLLQDDSGNLATLSISGDYVYVRLDDNSTYSDKTIQIRKVDTNGNAVNYTPGETLATIASNNVKADTFFLDESAFGGNEITLKKEGNVLKAAAPVAKVILDESYTFNGVEYPSTATRTYTSFDEAIAAIGGSDFKNSTGNRVHTGQGPYTIELLENCSLSKNMTVSSLATSLTITTPQGETHALDMQGHTLTSAGAYRFALNGGATLTNTSATRAAVNFTHKYSSFRVDASALPDNTTVINGVNISTSKATNISESVFTADAGKKYKVENSTITAHSVQINGGDWTADAFNVNFLNVGACNVTSYDQDGNAVCEAYKKSTLAANTVTATTFVAVFNTTTIGTLTLNGGSVAVWEYNNSYPTRYGYPEVTGNTPELNVTTLNVQKKNPNQDFEVTVDKDASMSVTTFNLGANRFNAFGTTEIGTLNSSNGAKIELFGASVTTINDKGVLYGLTIYGTPTFNVRTWTTLAINGSVTREDNDSQLDYHILNDNGDLAGSIGVLFTTNMKSFPVEMVKMNQPAGSKLTALMQIGSSVMVAGEFITVGTIQYDNDGNVVNEIALKKFAKWSDAIAYINEIANATTDYYIEISDDITTMEAFSVPAKAKSVTIRGTAGVNPTITCLGNLAPATDVTFKDIKVRFTTYDATQGYVTNDKAVMNFSGRKITLDNAYFLNKFSAANGAKNSTLVLKKGNMPGVEAALTVTGALTTGGLTVDCYTIAASNVTSQTEATLKSATITSAGNITFVNVTSLDANNKLTTGAGKANKLTISGTYSDNAGGNTTVTILGAEGTGTATAVINTNAISISSKYIESEIAKAEANGVDKSYVDYTGQVLATAAKLPATALVIGRQDDTVSFLTKKNGNNLVVDPSTEIAVTLYEVVGNVNQVRGNFAALQDALTEIDRYANKSADYEIQLVSEKSTAMDEKGNGKVTSYNKDLSMPRQLASLTITSADALEPGIFTKGTLTLNSDLTLKNVKIYPYNNLTVNLGNYSLSVENADIANGKPIANINSANTSGKSGLAIKYTNAYTTSRVGVDNWTINGNLRTSKLSLNGANVTVHGTTSVGEIKQEGIASSLRGTAKVATKKVNGELQIADVTPNVTIDRTITSEPNEFSINLDVVRTENREKYYNDLLSVLEDYKNYDEFRESTGIKFAKALKADAAAVSFEGQAGSVVKRGGFLLYTSLTTLPYTLTTSTDTVPCFSFADAVTEINNRNDKNADYTITANESDGYYEDHPETFAMPATAKLHSLTIQAKDNGNAQNPNHAVLYYGSKNAKGVVSAIGKITLTTDTTVKNITFMDAEVASKLDADPTTVPNRAPLTLALGGKNVVLENVTFEGRALLIDGGRNGNLTLKGTKGFTAVRDIDADYLAEYPSENIVEGNITNLKTLTLDEDSALLMRDYVSNARGAVAKTTLSVTNFTGNGNNIQSQGNVSLVNVTAEGSNATIIEADGTFTVSGTLTASLDNNLVLIGRQKNDRNKTPQLNVTGTVADKKVLVALLPYDVTDQDANTALVPSGTAGLAVVTSAKNGVEKFSVAKTVEMDQAEALYTGATAATFDPTAAAALRGTALVKTGNLMYAYDASNIHVGVKIVDESAIATRLTNLNNENMMGYYLTFADAVNAINAKNNRNNCYDIVLLDDINVASVALPAANRAKAVSVQGYSTAKKLTLNKAFAIPVSTTLIAMTVEAPSVSQTAKTTLTMNGNSVLYGTNGAVSLQNIATDGTAKINYTRNNRSQSQLTIAGDVTNTTGKLTLCMAKNYKNANAVVGDSASYMAKDKAEINANKLLFTGTKVKSGDVEIKIGDEALTTTVSADANAVVKNANGFYFVNSSFLTEAVGLGDGDEAPHTYYLDLNQATNQIKVNANKKDYTVYLGVASDGATASTTLDANVTDRNAHSAIVLPTNNTVGALTIKENNSNRTAKLYYSGSLTGYVGAGKALTFENVELVPVAANDKNGAVQPVTNSNITVNRNSADRTGEVGLVLYNVSVSNGNGGVGYLNAIVGQRNVTNVETNNPLTLVTGFTNVNTLTINGANEVVAGGRSSINTLDFENANAGFVAIGATTVGTIRTANYVPTASLEKKAYGYIVGNGRGFTLSGGVTGENTVVPVKVLKAGAKYNNFDVIDPADSLNLNIDLLTAPKADPSRIILFGEPTNGTSTKLTYKFGNTLRVDEKNNLKVKVTGDELSAYAHDYPEAIAAINTWGDKTKDYTITFLDTAGDVVTTNATKNIAVPTNITYPRANAAKSLTITSETNAKTLQYTANLSPVVATTFDKVKLDNGTYNGRTRVFTSYHNVNIAATGAALTFTENAKTVSDDNGTASATFDVNAINSTKGLTLNGQTVKANGTVNITTLNVNGDVAIRSNNGKAITLTNVVGSAGTDHLTLDAPISGSATALNTPQLKINGTVNGVETLVLDPMKAIYNGRTLTGWEYMTEDDLDARRVVGGEKAAELKNKVLSNGMQKVPTDIITVNKNTSGVQVAYAFGADSLYKSGANLYLLSDPSLLKVKVTATGYEAKFLTWADAVNDINARRDNTVDYTIALLDTIGGEETATNVSIAFPAANAAKSVTVTEEGGQRQLYFTNGSLSVGTNVTIDGVELIPVKNFVQYGQRGFWVNPSGYAISISGNNTLTFKGYPDDTLNSYNYMTQDTYTNISTISGGNLVLDDKAIVTTYKNVSLKNLTLKKATCLKVTSGNLTVQNSLTMTEQSTQQGENISNLRIEGNATLKNPTIAGGSVFANNITTQGTATLSEDASLIAALDKKKGQGKLTVADLVLGNNGCTLCGKQDANGNSMMNVTGTVTKQEGLANPDNAMVRVGMLYNNVSIDRYNPTINGGEYVSLMDGVKLLTAAKIAKESIAYFTPLKDEGDGDGHVLTDGYTSYMLPKNSFMFYGVKPANAL